MGNKTEEHGKIRVLAFPAYKNRKSNPYNYLLNSAISNKSVDVTEFSFLKSFSLKYDIIHIHWPEFYLGSHYFTKALVYSTVFLVSLFWAKIFGRKIVWTVHNLVPHKIRYKYTNKIFWKLFLSLVNGFISLSEANDDIARKTMPRLNRLASRVTYHGLYEECYSNDLSFEEARQKLSIPLDKDVFLFFGQVKPYKNIEKLISVFLSSDTLKDKVLLIAGKFESNKYKQHIEGIINKSPRVKIFEGFVKDDDIQCYFNAANLSIIPFKNIFNSGSMLLSISFDTTVIMPFSENFNEYSHLVKGIYLYENELNSEVILSALKNSKAYPVKNSNDHGLSWSVVANKTIQLYRDVLKK